MRERSTFINNKIIRTTATVFISACFVLLAVEILLRLLAPILGIPLKALIREELTRGAQSTSRIGQGSRSIFKEEDFNQPIDIVVIGDSMVFGTLVTVKERFTALMEKESGLKILNLGIPSSGPCTYNRMLELSLSRLKKPPRTVFYVLFANDFNEDPCHPPEVYKKSFIWESDITGNISLRFRRAREALFQRSLVYHLLKRLIGFGQLNATGYHYSPVLFHDSFYDFAFAPVPWWAWQLKPVFTEVAKTRLMGNILEAKTMTEKAGSKFCVVMMPFKEQIYVPLLISEGKVSPQLYDIFYDSTYDEIIKNLQAVSISPIDLRPAFRNTAGKGQKLFWTVDGHLTPDGHKLVAAELKKSLWRGTVAAGRG